MRQHILDLLQFNDWANKRILKAIRELPKRDEALRLFSHCVTAQEKWRNRVQPVIDDSAHSWFGEVFSLEKAEKEAAESIQAWIRMIEHMSEADLACRVVFPRVDGKRYSVAVSDLALQINYHNIHHRAQILRVIREQGITPPTVDYVLTRVRETA